VPPSAYEGTSPQRKADHNFSALYLRQPFTANNPGYLLLFVMRFYPVNPFSHAVLVIYPGYFLKENFA